MSGKRQVAVYTLANAHPFGGSRAHTITNRSLMLLCVARLKDCDERDVVLDDMTCADVKLRPRAANGAPLRLRGQSQRADITTPY